MSTYQPRHHGWRLPASHLLSLVAVLAEKDCLDGSDENLSLGYAGWKDLDAAHIRARITEVVDVAEVAEILERHELPLTPAAWQEVVAHLVARETSFHG